MSPPSVPSKTEAARQLLAGPRGALPAPWRMLLISVDGQRSLDELRAVARSLKLPGDALEQLSRDGLIALGPSGQGGALARGSAGPSVAPASARPAQAVAPASAALVPRPPAGALSDLRQLMKAKMFALDLAGRMLAGRDGDLRDRARAVDSESSFIEWMADASARIEAAASPERAQLFRDRVAQSVA